MKRTMLSLCALILITGASFAGENEFVVEGHYIDTTPNRGFMGLNLKVVESTDSDGRALDNNGMYVIGLVAEGPAELAGIRRKDRIVLVEGQTIRNMDDLHLALDGTAAGDRVDVVIDRGGREERIVLELGERPVEEVELIHHKWAIEQGLERPFIGVETQPLTDALADYFEVESGLLISRVVDDSPAYEAGLEAGDVIVSWDEKAIRSSADLHKMLATREIGDDAALSVSRRGVESRVFVTLGESPNAFVIREHGGPEARSVKIKLIEEARSKD